MNLGSSPHLLFSFGSRARCRSLPAGRQYSHLHGVLLKVGHHLSRAQSEWNGKKNTLHFSESRPTAPCAKTHVKFLLFFKPIFQGRVGIASVVERGSPEDHDDHQDAKEQNVPEPARVGKEPEKSKKERQGLQNSQQGKKKK